jgi:hypothetical protein
MSNYTSMIRWWAVVVAGAAAVLLFAWLARLAGVPLEALLLVAAILLALTWMIVLVTVPWNLYFAARRVVAGMAVSRRRAIAVDAGDAAEAARIARRMLWFAIGGHVGTAAVVAVVAAIAAAPMGYYVAGFYLLSTAIRPAAAYFAHLRARILTLGRESTHPRDDVVTLRRNVAHLTESVDQMRAEFRQEHRNTAADLAHLRHQVTTDLTRIEDTQAADRAAARTHDDQLGARIEQMVRRIDATLDGISDHQELLTGIRALVRMIRADAV